MSADTSKPISIKVNIMIEFSAAPREMIASPWRHRDLIVASVKREVLGRYRGSFLGLFWSFFNPLLMLFVYTFVFSVVFKARWGVTGSDSKAEFALVLFAGLIVFNIFAECFNRSTGLILNNVNYVKKVIYPLDILPWISLGSALFHGAISLIVWLLAYTFFYGVPHLTVLLLPLIFLPFIFIVMGITWFLASLSVFLRDVAQFVGVFTTMLMFLSPIFYPITALPENYRVLLYMNPLTPIIEQSRAVLFWGDLPDFKLLACYGIASLLIAWLGFAMFQKTRKGFADVL